MSKLIHLITGAPHCVNHNKTAWCVPSYIIWGGFICTFVKISTHIYAWSFVIHIGMKYVKFLIARSALLRGSIVCLWASSGAK